MSYDIKNEGAYYAIYQDGCFVSSADTLKEAKSDVASYELADAIRGGKNYDCKTGNRGHRLPDCDNWVLF